MNSTVDKLLTQKVNFLADFGTENDIAISSRIRLARNLAHHKFPVAAEEKELAEICDAVRDAADAEKPWGEDSFRFEPDQMSSVDSELLFERRLASREFLNREHGTLLLAAGDESSSVMVNEEDHLRMQAMCPGFCLASAWDRINAIDDLLGKHLEYAFDNRLGFLTSCPTNVGTGMRASVMLHLPGLVLTGRVGAAIQGINKLSFAVRGIFGEGTENLGNLFQISNQSTLGESEQGIIERLTMVIGQLIEHEKNARDLLLRRDKYEVLDLIGRSYGTLRYAYKLTSEDALKSLSAVRLGVDLGVFNSLNVAAVNELLISIAPAHLQKRMNRELQPPERDIARAAFCR